MSQMDISESDTMTEGLREIYSDAREMMKGAPPAMVKWLMLVQKKELPFVLQMIVVALLEKKGEVYGYEILNLSKHLGSGVKISASSVYPMLHKMERDGYIKGSWKGQKKVYTITSKGKKMAKWTKESLKLLVTVNTKFVKLLFDEEVKL